MNVAEALTMVATGAFFGGIGTYRIMYDRCYDRIIKQLREEDKQRKAALWKAGAKSDPQILTQAESEVFRKAPAVRRRTAPREDAGRPAVIHKAKLRKANRNVL